MIKNAKLVVNGFGIKNVMILRSPSLQDGGLSVNRRSQFEITLN